MKRARHKKADKTGQPVLNTKNKKKFKLNKFAVVGICLGVLLVSCFAVLGFSGIFNKPEEPENSQTQPVQKETGKVNALVLGVDKKGLLTDTIIIASYDLSENKMRLLSIPRDTRIYIDWGYQKINAAYSVEHNKGGEGAQGTIEAVTRLTGIPINYYIKFETNAFQDLINALGGVEFDVPQDMDYDDPVQDLHIHLEQGLQHLDGDKAEQLVRFRNYRDGDIERVRVQQQFIQAVAEQHLNVGIITKLPELYTAIQENIETNATLTDVTKYIPNLLELTVEDISMYQLPGAFGDVEEYGASYWIADMAQVKALVEDVFGYDASNATTGKPGTKSEERASQAPAQATSTPRATSRPQGSTASEETEAPERTRTPQRATARPTTRPAAEPTVRPTEEPASMATARPTQEPTAEPATPRPTETPQRTQEPTAAPTRRPERTPVPKPTANPTNPPESEE